MTLEILVGTPLDLGPSFWAVAILVALVLIELFQLGPHKFAAASKKGKKGKPGNSAIVTLKGGPQGLRKRHIHGKHTLGTIDKALFRDCVVNVHYFGERNHALLYLGAGGEELDLHPKPPASKETTAGDDSEEIYPPEKDRENYVIAWGKEPEELVLSQLPQLWSALQSSSDANKYLVMYCSREPSTYAVQRITEELGTYTEKVGVSVLYDQLGGGEAVEGEEEEKIEHLKKAGITMSKI